MKKGRILAMVCCGALVAAPIYLLASAHNQDLKLRQIAKAKMLALEKHLPADGKSGLVVLFPNMAVPVGEVIRIPVDERQQHIDVQFRREDFAGEKSPWLHKLQDRVDWFEDISISGFGRAGVSTVYQTGKLPMNVQRFIIYGVEVVEVKDKQGNKKYRAVRPVSVGMPNASTDLDKPVPLRYYPAYSSSRSDFVNPEDIDWMYAVKDFAQVTVP